MHLIKNETVKGSLQEKGRLHKDGAGPDFSANLWWGFRGLRRAHKETNSKRWA